MGPTSQPVSRDAGHSCATASSAQAPPPAPALGSVPSPGGSPSPGIRARARAVAAGNAALGGGAPRRARGWALLAALMVVCAAGVIVPSVSQVSQAATAPATGPAASVPLPLRTSGSTIVDAAGNEVILQGVNWFGFETALHAPHGLWTRDYVSMLAQIRSLGFNVIRLPFSVQAWQSPTTSGIDFSNAKNTALAHTTPQQAMEVIVDAAAAQGLMVILDNHSLADDGYMHGLWYGQGGFNEDDWVANWQSVAAHFRSRPNVIGYDLKNEPHGAATWGDGTATDWRRAAERAGAAIQAIDAAKLIIVEGIEGPVAGGQYLNGNWWGGNLEGVRNNPVRLPVANKVVYSPHEYGPGVASQPWFAAPNVAQVLADRWAKGFGYLRAQSIAPVLVGEFGAKNVGTDTLEGRWIRQFADYMGAARLSWAFWSWNPDSGDTGGLLNDDWTTLNTAKVALLQALRQRLPIDFGQTPTTPTTTTPTTPTTTQPTVTTTTAPPAPGGIVANVVTDSAWTGGWCGKISVRNTSAQTLRLASVGVTLAAGTAPTSVWNGTATVAGPLVTIATPSWAQAAPGATYADTGLCVNGAAPTAPTWSALGAPPAATPTTAPPTTAPPATAPPTTAPPATAPPTTAPPATAPPTPGVSVTPVPATAGVQVSLRTDSDWGTGFCQTAVVTNSSGVAVTDWTLRFGLSATARITDAWNGTVSRSGGTVTVRPAVWAAQLAPNQTRSDFGFCAAR